MPVDDENDEPQPGDTVVAGPPAAITIFNGGGYGFG